jgi:hypothetical protein
MKTIHKNFSIEITDGGDIVIGKDNLRYLTIKNNGTLELQGSTGIWSAIKNAKIHLLDGVQKFSGVGTEIYQRSRKICIASVNSDRDNVWAIFDFDNPSAGWQTSTSEPD